MIVISKMVATRLHQPWRAILSVLNRCLTGKDSSWDTVRLPILQMLWGIVHSANLDFTSLIWDECEWKTVERSSRPSKMSKLLYTRFTTLIIDNLFSHNKSIPRISDSKLHSSQDDHPITKLLSTTNGDYKFRMEVPDVMISDAIKKKAQYMYYMAKKVESKKAKIVDEPEEQHVSPVKSGRGKEAVVAELANSVSIQEPRSQRIQRSQLTIDSQTDKVVADMYNERGQKLKGPTVEDPAGQSLLDLQKGSKASRLESLRQKKQPVARDGSSATPSKYYSSSDTVSDATLYSSSADESKESANETNDADKSNMVYLMIIHMDMMMMQVQDDTPAMQSMYKADTLIQKHSNPEWFPKKLGLAKRRTTWFDLFLKSNIDKDENHILGPSTVTIAKKFKELNQKDELTIADLKGAGLEWIKVQYNNDVELEYHVSKLKAAVLLEAQWNSDEGDVS
ncbi:hypothetical protein Tco_0146401 [Tanacetum coccineum]